MGVLASWACRWLVAAWWWWFFPPTREIPEPVRAELESLFLNVDFGRVHVHAGVPLLIRFSWPDAMTLPGAADTESIHVYVRPALLDGADCETLGLLAHEFVHVQQYLAYADGRGIGLYRAFWYLYLVCALRFGYKQNPLEDEAERFENRVATRCNTEDGTTENATVGLCCRDIEFSGTKIRFLHQFVRAVPGLTRLWATVQALLAVSDASSESSNRGSVDFDDVALLVSPVFLATAAVLGVLTVAYGMLFALVFLIFTVVALSLWYVAKALYVAVCGALGVVCGVLVAIDALVVRVWSLV